MSDAERERGANIAAESARVARESRPPTPGESADRHGWEEGGLRFWADRRGFLSREESRGKWRGTLVSAGRAGNAYAAREILQLRDDRDALRIEVQRLENRLAILDADSEEL